MPDPRSATLLAHAAELQQRDDAVAEAIGSVLDLLAGADVVRARATEIRQALAALPAELGRVDEAEAEARRREDLARVELAEVERRLEEATRSRRAGEEAVAQARRELTRAAEALTDAGMRIGRLLVQRQALVDSGVALQAEAEGLAVTACEIAGRIRTTPRVSASGREEPGATLAGLEEWGARVHAALFVVRGGLEGERERIVVEANTLGAAVLGEQIGGSSVALVRKRLEGHLQGT